MQIHNYTITRSFSNTVHNLWKCCVICPIIVEYRLHYCSRSIAHTIETVWWRDEAKPAAKNCAHFRINGIKGGVVMNTNACTSNVIVSLSHVCAHYNHMHIPRGWICPSWTHPYSHTLLKHCRCWCSSNGSGSSGSAHILLLLMNFLPFPIFGWPKKPNCSKWTELSGIISVSGDFFLSSFSYTLLHSNVQRQSILRFVGHCFRCHWIQAFFCAIRSFEWDFFFRFVLSMHVSISLFICNELSLSRFHCCCWIFLLLFCF